MLPLLSQALQRLQLRFGIRWLEANPTHMGLGFVTSVRSGDHGAAAEVGSISTELEMLEPPPHQSAR